MTEHFTSEEAVALASTIVEDDDTNLFWGSQAAGYTESLKDNTP